MRDKKSHPLGGRHNSVVSSVPTILRPGFESQAHQLSFLQFVLVKLYRENNENKQKEAGIGLFLKKITSICVLSTWPCSFLVERDESSGGGTIAQWICLRLPSFHLASMVRILSTLFQVNSKL